MNPEKLSLLEGALTRAFNMEDDDARATAEVILEAFQGSEELADDEVPSDLRSIFYTLEAKKLMSFRREDCVREDGAKRRAFFWRMREEELSSAVDATEFQAEDDVYADLPMEAWSRPGAS